MKFSKIMLMAMLFAGVSFNVFAQCPLNLGPDFSICFGSSAMLDAGPGFTTYQWSTGANTQTINVAVGGVYSCTATDVASATCTDAVMITLLPLPSVILNCTNTSCIGCQDGSITAIVNGGTAPFTYQWNGGVFTTNTISNLIPGIYTIVVTDANGCVFSATCTITDGFGPVGTGPFALQGNVFYDADSNGVKDANEQGAIYQLVKCMPDSLSAYTDSAGNYTFYVDSGAHTLEFVPQTDWSLTSDSSVYNVNISGNSGGYDFGTKCSLPTDLSCNLNNAFPRCGWVVPFYINDVVTANPGQTGYVKMIIDPALTYSSAIPVPSSVNGDTLTWNFTTTYFNNSQNYIVYLSVPSNAGYMFNTYAEISLTDANNNIIESCFDTTHNTVLCSYDPNDKAVEPAGNGPQHTTYVDLNNTLDYTIRFQNTGNDTAFTVVIRDQLDANLDVGTFRFLGSSHPVKSTLLDHLLEFRFDPILLADSNVNEPASHGFVNYSIRTIVGLPTPFTVNNFANIYFDQNAPVITNTVLNTMEALLGVNENIKAFGNVTVAPNPFSNEAILSFENKMKDVFELNVFDVLSKKQFTSATAASQFLIPAKGLKSGMYFFTLINKKTNEELTGKLIIK